MFFKADDMMTITRGMLFPLFLGCFYLQCAEGVLICSMQSVAAVFKSFEIEFRSIKGVHMHKINVTALKGFDTE